MARSIIDGVNYNIEFDVDSSFKGKIDGERFNFNITSNKDNNYTILYQNNVFDVDVISFNYDEKLISLLVNGESIDVELEDKFDFIIKKLGLRKSNSIEEGFIESIMPGLIVDIHAVEGERVVKGQKLITLEAMKMENIIKSPSDSLIKKVSIEKGDTVEKGDILFELE